LLRFPMTNAVVKAMDATQDFVKSERNKGIVGFVVGGASKRGWTTWTTAIVDRRVLAIVPIVAPVLNLTEQMNHMWQAYGSWSFALQDYAEEGVPSYINTQYFDQLMSLVGPSNFVDRLTIPKYVICATGDEFFMPEAAALFWQYLQGPSYLRMLPNCEHSIFGHQIDVFLGIQDFFEAVVHFRTIPTVTWTISPNGTVITATSTEKPKKVYLFSAVNEKARDFRLIICADRHNVSCLNPILWAPHELTEFSYTPGVGYTYTGVVDVPVKGYRGGMIEFNYNITRTSGALDPFKLTTAVSIVPTSFPYPPCPVSVCASGKPANLSGPFYQKEYY